MAKSNRLRKAFSKSILFVLQEVLRTQDHLRQKSTLYTLEFYLTSSLFDVSDSDWMSNEELGMWLLTRGFLCLLHCKLRDSVNEFLRDKILRLIEKYSEEIDDETIFDTRGTNGPKKRLDPTDKGYGKEPSSSIYDEEPVDEKQKLRDQNKQLVSGLKEKKKKIKKMERKLFEADKKMNRDARERLKILEEFTNKQRKIAHLQIRLKAYQKLDERDSRADVSPDDVYEALIEAASQSLNDLASEVKKKANDYAKEKALYQRDLIGCRNANQRVKIRRNADRNFQLNVRRAMARQKEQEKEPQQQQRYQISTTSAGFSSDSDSE